MIFSGIPVANQLAAGYSETRQIWLYRAPNKAASVALAVIGIGLKLARLGYDQGISVVAIAVQVGSYGGRIFFF